MRAVAAILALVAASPALGQEASAWRAVDAATGEIRDVDGLEQLARDFPDSASVKLRALQPLIAVGDVEKVMLHLEWLYERGYVFSDIAQEQIPKMLAGVDPGRIAERLRAGPEPLEASDVIATVPADMGLIESVIAPDGTSLLVVSSITQQSAYGSMDGENWRKLEVLWADDLTGIVSDERRQIGWFASSNVDESAPGEKLFNGLIGLRGGVDDALYISAPDGVTLSDLAISPDGIIFASDPLGGGVYFAEPDAAEISTLIEPGTLRSPQGLTISADGAKLYVSDYRYGIAIVDLANGTVTRLKSDIPVILDGVDGLWRHGEELIAVQNGTSPMRISAFTLSDDGTSVVGHRVLEQAHSGWTEPLGGSLDGQSLIYVATGQWDRYVKGEPAEGKPGIPTQIRRLPLK